MDTAFIVTAFVLGFFVKQIGLPPLVGFLAGGFVLNALGYTVSELLYQLSDIGIILLLFSIGLKVQIKKLLQPQVWGTASLHMGITVVVFGAVVYALSLAGYSYFSQLTLSTSLLFAFALSFSSTVFAVKMLEEKAEMASNHGRLAIGILIMQDFFAVIFITFSSGKVPSPLALGLVALFFLKKPLGIILDKSGHGELLVLLACILPIAGASVFEYVGLKPDLGALILGMIFAGHPKTDELAKAMFGFKDLFLVGFFLTIGMADLPNIQMLKVAGLLVLFVPLKVILFYLLLTRYRLRARTSLITSLNLANYSEFGLIVGALGVSQGWLGSEWLVIIAVAVSISMIVASPVGTMAPAMYERWNGFLKKFETAKRMAGEEVIDIGSATIAVLGMGRVGLGAYQHLEEQYGKRVVGLDFDEQRAAKHRTAGRRVVFGDAGDYDFWQRGISRPEQMQLVLLTMSHVANLKAAKRLQSVHHEIVVAAAAHYEDEVEQLKDAGVDHVFNIFGEAGAGLADHVCELQGMPAGEKR
ncbi:cation:proton antiporter family protein [Desulfogranum marinum]|uniref:cation:proton antiporter family protein n=1 Tax=Desulfogranum marinum TaxID=453220 RepID=UPI0019637764|nr:cation:proton antiporter family protein [Desulfogranum marinum]MBM9512038.1 cation:proton antiporter [Desulfogranum marinum]